MADSPLPASVACPSEFALYVDLLRATRLAGAGYLAGHGSDGALRDAFLLANKIDGRLQHPETSLQQNSRHLLATVARARGLPRPPNLQAREESIVTAALRRELFAASKFKEEPMPTASSQLFFGATYISEETLKEDLREVCKPYRLAAVFLRCNISLLSESQPSDPDVVQDKAAIARTLEYSYRLSTAAAAHGAAARLLKEVAADRFMAFGSLDAAGPHGWAEQLVEEIRLFLIEVPDCVESIICLLIDLAMPQLTDEQSPVVNLPSVFQALLRELLLSWIKPTVRGVENTSSVAEKFWSIHPWPLAVFCSQDRMFLEAYLARLENGQESALAGSPPKAKRRKTAVRSSQLVGESYFAEFERRWAALLVQPLPPSVRRKVITAFSLARTEARNMWSARKQDGVGTRQSPDVADRDVEAWLARLDRLANV